VAGGFGAPTKLSWRARRRARVFEELRAIDRAKLPTVLGVVGKFIAYPAIIWAVLAFASDSIEWGALATVVAVLSIGLFVGGSVMLSRRGSVSILRGLWIVWGIPTWSAISDIAGLF